MSLRERLGRMPQINWALVWGIVGSALLSGAIGMLACSLVALSGDGISPWSFVLPMMLTVPFGVWAVRKARRDMSLSIIRARDGFLAVTLAWALAAAAGALPYLLSGTISELSAAYFESMSGFSSTGATVFDKVEQVPASLLLWRSMSQWLGGIGIVVLVVALAPAAGAAAQRVFQAETSGVATERLTPRIVETAKILVGIYLALSVAAFLTYWAVGMSAWDSVNHAMTSVGTGGFSTHTESIAYFDSVAVELAVIFFMVAGGVNFAFYWRAIKGPSIWPQMAEVRVYLLLLLGGACLFTLSLWLSEGGAGGWQAVREAAFTAVSVQTGTGYATADFDHWNHFARALVLVLMFIGGCAGSTTGGMKVLRIMILWKTAAQEISGHLHPKAIQVLRVGGQIYPEQMRRAALGFFFVFMLTLGVGTLVLSASGLDTFSALSASLACLTVVGPGLGEVGAAESYSQVSGLGQWALSAMMLIGRLEIFTVLVLFTPLFWHRHGN